MKDVVIIGIGNILMQDDAMGVNVIRQLENENLPSTIEVVDGGTSALNMLSYFIEYKKLIIVDCLKAGHKPGTIYRIQPEDIAGYDGRNLTIHDVQILDVVKMAKMMGKFPQVVIFGIEPQQIDLGLEMTELMNSKIPEVIKHIKSELNLA